MKPVEPHEPAMPESLSHKVVRGGTWVFGLRVVNRGLSFIRTIILARLLAPEDFGLMGIAMLAIGTLETFSQTGFQGAIVQKRINVGPYLDTAWTVSAVRGILLCFILFSSAPLVSRFFNSPESTLVIQVVAVFMLLSGLKNVGIILFQKEMEFRRQFMYELSATVTDFAVAISLAIMFKSVWAMVGGGLAAHLVRLFMSYALHPYRPHAAFDREKFKDLFGFGRWAMGSSILLFLITLGDDIVVGKILGVAALGLYQMAYLISNVPATEITHVISQVTFPAYSKLQGDSKRLSQAYLDVLHVTMFISVPLAGGIFFLAPEFTYIFLGTQWIPMVPAMQVLAAAGLVRSIQATTGPVFLGIGKPHIETVLQIIRLAVLAVLIYPFTVYWGIAGASCAVLVSALIATVGFSLMVIRTTGCGVMNFTKHVGLPLMNTGFMILIMTVFKGVVLSVDLWKFFFLIGTGLMSYVLGACVFDRFLDYGIKKIIREKISSMVR